MLSNLSETEKDEIIEQHFEKYRKLWTWLTDDSLKGTPYRVC